MLSAWKYSLRKENRSLVGVRSSVAMISNSRRAGRRGLVLLRSMPRLYSARRKMPSAKMSSKHSRMYSLSVTPLQSRRTPAFSSIQARR